MDGRWDTSDLTGAADRARRATRRRWSARSTAASGSGRCSACKHWLNANSKAAGEEEHRRALRPRQRVLPAVARPDDDVLVGAVRRRPVDRARGRAEGEVRADAGRARAAARTRTCSRSAAAGAASPRSRRAPVIASPGCRCPTRRRPTRASGWRGWGSPTASSSGSRTTATSAASTTASCRSRCSRRSARSGGRRTSAASATSLRPGGRACIQTITIADERFERYRTQSDFIQQYIFPAACWPRRRDSLAEAGAAGLALERGIAFGPDYAETLKRWLAAFDAHRDAVRGTGLRRALHPLLALLPRVLRRRLRLREHRCRAIHAAGD